MPASDGDCELAPDEPERRECRERHQHREHGVEGRERIAGEGDDCGQQRVGALRISAGKALDDGVGRAAGDRCAVGHRERVRVGCVDDGVVRDVPAQHAPLVPSVRRGEDRQGDRSAEQRPERESPHAPPHEQAPAAEQRRTGDRQTQRLAANAGADRDDSAGHDARIGERHGQRARRVVVRAQARRDAGGEHQHRDAEDRDRVDEARGHAAGPARVAASSAPPASRRRSNLRRRSRVTMLAPDRALALASASTAADGSVVAECPETRRVQARTGPAASRSCRPSTSARRSRPWSPT